MPTVSYYAWIVRDVRPMSRPAGGNEQDELPAGLKVSVKEEYMKDGKLWCQIWAPPGYLTPPGYPEIWLSGSDLQGVPLHGAPIPSVPDGEVPTNVLAAVLVLLKWLKS